jgi:hypothetical protein
MKLFKFGLSLIFGLGFTLIAHGQITGYVYGLEANGTKVSLPQANVFWENSQTGVITDEKGFYTIKTVPGKTTLVASFVGYHAVKKIVISRQGKTDFVLQPKAQALDGVEVTGRAKATSVDAKRADLTLNLDDQELKKAACCNLSESFETNASVDISFSDAITGTKQIEMLGLAGKYALIQRENIPNVRGLNANSGMDFIPGPFLESIQVTKGLSSVMNGYESLTGQINAELFKPETAPRLLVNAFGNQGTRGELNLLYTQPLGKRSGNTTMLHAGAIPLAQDMNNDGFADIPLNQQINLTNRTHFKGTNGWEGQVAVSLIDQEKQGGQLSFLNDDLVAPSAWGFRASNRRAELYGKTGYVFSNEVARSVGFIYSASLQEKKAQFGQKNYTGRQNSFYFNSIFQDIIGTTAHKYRSGLSVQGDRISENLIGAAEDNLYSHERTEIVPGAYFEYTFAPNPRVTLVAGVRGDYNSYFEELYFTPRVNLRYAISDLTTFRVGGGRGQRSPNFIAENYSVLASNRTLIFTDSVQPEIAWNGGISLDQFIPVKGNKQIRLTADVFYTYFNSKQVIDLDVSALQAYYIMSQGSESLSAMAQADYTWFEGFETRLAYKYLRSLDQFINAKDWAYQVPRHRAFVNVNYQTKKEWKFDATLNWFGAKRQPSTLLSPEAFQRRAYSPNFSTVNLQINKTLKRFEFFVGVNNLLNFRQGNPIVNAQNPFGNYFDSNFTWGPIFGRMAYAGLYYRFN